MSERPTPETEAAPFFAIGQGELGVSPDIGETIECGHCGKTHKVEYGESVLPDGRKVPSKTLAFYICNGSTYLCGINGKDIRHRFNNTTALLRQADKEKA
jgi:hypothetical protein